MMEAKCTVIGGHSVRNDDVLFGYAVTGVVNPSAFWKNVGARAGDALLFTKPLGTGVISTRSRMTGLPSSQSLRRLALWRH